MSRWTSSRFVEPWRLTWAYLRHHPARWLLTGLAMAAATCMVVWVVSGYDALVRQYESFSRQSFGRYVLQVYAVPPPPPQAPGMPALGPERYVPPEVVRQLRADPAVAAADPMWSQRAMVRPFDAETFRSALPTSQPTTAPAGAAGAPPRRGGVMLIGTDAPEPPFPILRGRWIDPARPDALEAALSRDAAERLGVDVGDAVSAGVGERAQRLTVIGIVDAPVMPRGGARGAPQVRGPASGGLFVPMRLAETILGRPAQISFVSLALQPEADITAFRFGWQTRFNRLDPPLRFQNSAELEQELNDSATAENLRLQALAATGIALLAALFITFATLSMGVGERSRELAILRAVVLTRGQVGIMIGLESLLLAIGGWIGGVAVAWGLLWIVTRTHPALLGEGMLVGPWSLLLSAACAFGGAAGAAVIPAVRAMRQRPLDALAPQANVRPAHVPLGVTLAGVCLILVHPILTFVIGAADASQFAVRAVAGSACMAVGFILLAPRVVAMTERLAAPVLAALLRLDRPLLQMQLTTHLWRTVGTAVSLTVGLGLFVSMQVWGYTMLGPFVPGPWAPDVLVAFLPDGLPPDSADEIARLPGLDPDRFLPLAVEQPKLAEDITGVAQRATVTRQDNIVLVGLDGRRAFGGDDPIIPLQWIAGDPASAIDALAGGRGVIVPDHFSRETGLGIGGRFRVNPPGDSTRAFEYTVAGIVRLDGSHWMTKLSGMRLHTARSAALCFAAYDVVAGDFGLKRIRFAWADATGPVDVPRLMEAARALGERVTGRSFRPPPPGLPLGDQGAVVRITTPQDVTRRIRGRADGWIWSLSQLPLVTLCVASIGVLNAVLASVRARTWEMGVLRAVGFTRFTLVRLVIAEAILVGIVACVLSFGFGVLAGWCGAEISQYVSFFGGLHPSLTIPWARVAAGLGAALALCLLAALWPAVQIGRRPTLDLLQSGRAAF